ncbi:MAG: lipopolysaccharide heptosyltransferase I [Proteobacteria bacterium]|nr:lipopolysaccharide heptosyltransferase I [Pseudomonadota bacterium]
MKRVLVIKTSSLGDVVHTLPALTDAQHTLGEVQFDWVVEESLAEIPAWHPAVNKVIPVALRRWRKSPIKAWRSGEWAAFKQALRAQDYDKVIDAQGLIKSALLTRIAKGPHCGQSARVAREPLAAWAYDEKHDIARGQHAIDRVRQLFAACLDYAVPVTDPDYGINKNQLASVVSDKPYLVFLHGTAWKTKQWPESYWQQLIKLATDAGYEVRLPWGNKAEQERAQSLAKTSDSVEVCERMDLKQVAALIAGSAGVAATDTGLGHLTAALAVPSVTVYGPTRPGLTGTRGPNQQQLESHYGCAPCFKRRCKKPALAAAWPPCFAELDPDKVWQSLAKQIEGVC